MRWVDDRVIGYNLCPFAKAPRANDGLKLVVCEHDSTDAFFATFAREVELLCETYTDADEAYDDEDGEEAGPPSAAADADFVNNDEKDTDPAPRWRGAGLSEPSTTLIAVPYVQQLADDFVLFLAVAERCEEILEETGVTDKVQLAAFHPEYHFGRARKSATRELHQPVAVSDRAPAAVRGRFQSGGRAPRHGEYPGSQHRAPQSRGAQNAARGAQGTRGVAEWMTRLTRMTRMTTFVVVAIYTKGTRPREALIRDSSVTEVRRDSCEEPVGPARDEREPGRRRDPEGVLARGHDVFQAPRRRRRDE